MGGEQDMATRMHLSVVLAEAAGLDDADIVVDLSEVTFMDASTVGALVMARDRLRALSRSLTVRDPSPPARRLLDLCGLERLIDEPPAAQLPGAAALGSWVSVPARDRDRDSVQPAVTDEAPFQEPALAMERRVDTSRSVRKLRAPP
ncbi:MAG: STAS domain-containing protein [Actinomycetota bacterium]|nr:STAS domain-containing protein [Actinomycetota bacterium]